MRNALVPTDERVPRYLVGASVVLALLTGVETLLRVLGVANSGPDLVFSGEFFVGLITTVPFVAAIGYAGHWLARSDLDPGHNRRIAVWTVGGTAMFLAINLALVVFTPVNVWILVAWVRWAVALGGGISVLVGISEARAIHSALEAERAMLEAEHLESQRDVLEYLNGLLRHEVLNAANVISGYAEMLKDECAPGERTHQYSGTIQRQSDDMAAVIRDVRVLLDAMAGESELASMDLGAILAEEVAKLEDTHDRVEVDVVVPGEVTVLANALLPRVFGNLLSNAVEHNDSETPRVTVVVEAAVETVTVEVIDNGPGIPDGAADTLFDRPGLTESDHGIGLYLVSVLVDSYDGTIELTETGPDGSTFAIELPRGTPALADRAVTGRAATASS